MENMLQASPESQESPEKIPANLRNFLEAAELVTAEYESA